MVESQPQVGCRGAPSAPEERRVDGKAVGCQFLRGKLGFHLHQGRSLSGDCAQAMLRARGASPESVTLSTIFTSGLPEIAVRTGYSLIAETFVKPACLVLGWRRRTTTGVRKP